MISMVLWEFLFSLLDTCLLMKFCGLFLQYKKDSHMVKFIGMCVLSILIFVISYSPVFSYASSFILLCVSILYCVAIFKGEVIYKIAIGILFQVLYLLYSIGLVSLVAMLLGDNAKYIYEYDSSIRIMFILFTRLVFFLVLWVISYKMNYKKLKLFLPKSVFLFLCIILLIIFVITNLLYNNINTSIEKDIYLLILGVIIFSFIFVVTLKNFFDEKAKREDLEIQKRSLEMQKEDYYTRIKMDQDVRKMKHDLKNNLISIASLIQEKKYDEAESYLSKLSGMSALKKVVDTGNPVIDGLLNVNIQTYGDINFHIHVDVIDCAIDFDVLSTILGNIMNNAIESTLSNLENNPDVFIRISENEKRVIIEIENGYKQEPVTERGKLVTSKKDHLNHGFGMHNIEQAAKKYSGQVNYDINKKDKIFKISVLLLK